MNLEIGDIIFYKSNSFIGKLICKLSKSEYSHVSMYMGNDLILEADRFIESRLTELVVEDKTIITVKRYSEGLTEEQKLNLQQNVHSVLGRKYGYRKILYLFLNLAFNMDIKSIVNDLNTFICTELVDYEYSTVGIDIVPNVVSHIITPYQLEFSPLLTSI